MIVECPSCGCRFQVKSGRPNSELFMEILIPQLRDAGSVKKLAEIINVDVKTIYKKFKYIGIDPKTITGRTYTIKEKNIEN